MILKFKNYFAVFPTQFFVTVCTLWIMNQMTEKTYYKMYIVSIRVKNYLNLTWIEILDFSSKFELDFAMPVLFYK